MMRMTAFCILSSLVWLAGRMVSIFSHGIDRSLVKENEVALLKVVAAITLIVDISTLAFITIWSMCSMKGRFLTNRTPKYVIAMGPVYHRSTSGVAPSAVGLSTYKQSAGTKSLHVFCSEDKERRHFYSANPRMQNYFTMCRNVEKYQQCVLRYRNKPPANSDLVVEVYEQSFPAPDDLKIASYTFCIQDLLKVRRRFEDKNLDCENKLDTSTCQQRHVTPEAVSRLQAANNQTKHSWKVVSELSCSIIAPLTACVEDMYMTCNSDYAIFKNYELARLGRNCLQSQRIYSSYMMIKKCASCARTVHQDTTLMWLLANLMVMTLCIVRWH